MSRNARRAAFDEFAAGLKPERAAVIMPAIEGLRLTNLLGASLSNAKRRNAIIAELLRLAED